MKFTEASEHKNDDLVPNFMPTLGQRLALHEQEKQQLLTADEIYEILDNAACMMVQRAHYEKMHAKDEIRDINPENVVAEWHRRRIEFVSSYWPQFILYVVTKDKATENCKRVLDKNKFEYDLNGSDPEIVNNLANKDSRIMPSLTEEEIADMAAHTHYFAVRSEEYKSSDAVDIAARILALIPNLIEAGALGISVESSHIMHSNAVWMSLFDSYKENPFLALQQAFVQKVVLFDEDYGSVGMHSLGQPDYRLSTQTLTEMNVAPEEMKNTCRNIFSNLGYYLLADCPADKFVSGNKFNVDGETPPLRVTIEPCTFFQETDIRFNPFGVWRLSMPQE